MAAQEPYGPQALHGQVNQKLVERVLNSDIVFGERAAGPHAVHELGLRHQPRLEQEEIPLLRVLVEVGDYAAIAEGLEGAYAALPVEVYDHAAQVEYYCIVSHLSSEKRCKSTNNPPTHKICGPRRDPNLCGLK